ncbi:MAG: V-type ATPase subunit [Clostridia bacterium]|nr:V-type ATPase subunit [Clostridia bacterium]
MINYQYINARAKALENGLLGKDRLNRIAESSSAEEGLKILYEVNFGEGAVISSPLEFETLVSVEQTKLYNFIRQIGEGFFFGDFILLQNDFHNAEAYIKSKYLKIPVEKMLVPEGKYKLELLAEKIMTDEYKGLDKYLAEALLLADSEFVSGKATGRSINSIFKKSLYKRLHELSNKDKDLKAIYSAKADCANIAIALRTRNYQIASESFVEGGTLTESEKQSLCEESIDALRENSKFFGGADFVKAALAENIGSPLTEFELLSDGYAVKYLKKQKYSVEGIKPLMLYVYYKLAELTNVRIAMVGLINGLNETDVKRRMRETYEG